MTDHTAETRIYYALDSNKTYRLIDERLLQKLGLTEQQVREMALFNARSLGYEFKQDTVAGNTFYFLNTNDGYDATRILNESLLQSMREKISGDMVVAVPHQDVLIIADIVNEIGYDIIAQMTMKFFEGHVPITSLSFVYEDGDFEPIFILAKNRKKTDGKGKDERSERFYNLEGIGDTLIVALQDITLENRTFDAQRRCCSRIRS